MSRLSAMQKEIVTHDEGPLLVLAGPGSGKTRVLTERIRRLVMERSEHFRILALTFTNKAANEMLDRLSETTQVRLRVFVGTFHSFCLEVLSNRGRTLGIDGTPHIFESFKDRRQVLLEAVMDDAELRPLFLSIGDSKDQNTTLTRWLEIISNAKNDLLIPEMLDDSVHRKLYEAYQAGLKGSSALDFDDLLLLTYRLFQERPKIADFYRRQYRYVCIDEAQDLNNAQYQVLCALCGNNYNNVLMVGDPNQAIYGWNGADPRFLKLFETQFRARTILLKDNYRSSRAIVNAAQALYPSYTVEGVLPIRGERTIMSFPSEEEEADFVVSKIEELLVKGHPDIEGVFSLNRCAVLGRTRYVFKQLEERLKERSFPYYKQVSLQEESESDLIRQFELALRVIVNPHDKLHLNLLLKQLGTNNTNPQVLPVSCKDDSISGEQVLSTILKANNSPYSAGIADAISALGAKDDLKFGAALSHLEKFASNLGSEEERALILEDINEWREHWDYYLRSHIGGHQSVISFLSQVSLGATLQPARDGLGLLTVHSAKGLEFDVVFIVAMCDGVFPDYRAINGALEEEKRNAFVAITRAKRLLYITYPETRLMPWGAQRIQTPSRFLKGLLSSPISGVGDEIAH